MADKQRNSLINLIMNEQMDSWISEIVDNK